MIDTDELRQLAQAATSGAWRADIKMDDDGRSCYARVYPVLYVHGFQGAICGQKSNRANGQMAQRAANIRFIAKASPATINALLDRIELLERQAIELELVLAITIEASLKETA